MNEKEILAIVECLKQFQGIFFGYEINSFSYHKTLVYAANLREYQRAMLWRIIHTYFGPNIQHIAGVDKIVSDMLSRLPYTPIDKYEPCTGKDQCRASGLFTLGRVENNEYRFPLNILILQREQQKELRNINSKLSTYTFWIKDTVTPCKLSTTSR